MTRGALLTMARMTMTLLLVFVCVAFCRAQSPSRTSDARRQSNTQTPNAAQSPSPQSQSRSLIPPRGEADENFDLDIAERRITEPNFFASTEVSAGDEAARGLALRIGVEVGAERIDVLLRNVRGHVRFHASLDALRRVLDARRATTANEPTPNVL